MGWTVCEILHSKIRFWELNLMFCDVFIGLQTNRLAKLKQSKLDVRREQWLSHGMCFSFSQVLYFGGR